MVEDQRLDKWLWCARFYKTRTLATEAIKAGRVAVNGQSAKPAKLLAVGDQLLIKMPPYEFAVSVHGLVAQRVSAPLAKALYLETPDSIAAREKLATELRLGAILEDRAPGKLSKHDRRAREAFQRELDRDDT